MLQCRDRARTGKLVLWMLWGGVGVGWGGGAAELGQQLCAGVEAAQWFPRPRPWHQPAVLGSHSYAMLFQLLPPAEGVNPNHLFLEPELPCLFTPLAFMWLQWPLFSVAQLCARLGF